MTTFTEAAHDGSFIMSEAPGQRSRENAVLVAGQDLGAGAVLGKITASGKYTAYDNAAGDGSQAAAAILIYATDATDADVAVSIIRRDAEVNFYQLDWGSQSAAESTAGVDDLAALGIICRERPEVEN